MLSWVDSGLSDIPEHMYEGSYIYAKQHWIPSGNDDASISIDGGESFYWDIRNDYEFILDGYEDDQRTATIAITDNWNYTDYGYLVIENVQPAAELSYDPGDEGGDYTLNLSDFYDPSGADTSAGFTYAFANTYADLSEPGNLTSTPSHTFDLQDSDGVVWARIYDKDGGYSDYNTSYVLPTINLGQVSDTEVNLAWLDVATSETSWLVQRAPLRRQLQHDRHARSEQHKLLRYRCRPCDAISIPRPRLRNSQYSRRHGIFGEADRQDVRSTDRRS